MRERRASYTFEEPHSWLAVGLQILCGARWRPENTQPHTVNIKKALPPEGLAAHFFPREFLANYDPRLRPALGCVGAL